MSRYPFKKITVLGAGVGRDLGVGVGLVATVTTQRVVNGNNFVTFQISRAALFGAILSSNKHINTYEND